MKGKKRICDVSNDYVMPCMLRDLMHICMSLACIEILPLYDTKE